MLFKDEKPENPGKKYIFFYFDNFTILIELGVILIWTFYACDKW